MTAGWTPEEFNAMFGLPDSYDEAKLHPDLKPYMGEAPMGRMLRHPLVYSLPPVSWRYANAAYEARQELVAQKRAKQDWYGALAVYERPWRLTMLDLWWFDIDPDERGDILLELWADTEMPWQFGELPLRLFKAVREMRPLYLTDDTPGDHEALPVRIEVFRGTGTKEPPGIAWTRDRDRAVWFATRLRDGRDGRRPLLLSGSVHRDDVLAYIVGRGEHEIVVDPANVLRPTRTLL